MQEAVNKTSAANGEKENSSAQERIELRLKANRFLVVLDDMWTCHEDEWKQLLAPFRRGGEKGNVIIVTTRIPKVAEMVKTVHSSIEMDRLGDEDLMHFFEECVFGNQTPWRDPPGLHDVGKKIVSKLKGFPLAAKTVGRLLRKQLTLDSWTRVLESKEWEQQTNKNDIMPALKLSYEYLPFHLQQCFSYCSLFPEDYEFRRDELIHLWRGLGILHPCGQNTRTKDIGQSYLIDLVNYGFLKEEGKDDSTHYVVHDLLHDLAVEVSSYECVTIPSSALRSIQIPTSVRHLSIIIEDKEVENRGDFDNFKKELRELDKRYSAQNLRTLMLFGSHHGSFAKTFGHLFRDARGLRTIYLSGASYGVEDILHNFSKLIHLRYLRIKSVRTKDTLLPAAMSRLYHLEVIDLQEWTGSFSLTRHMSSLVKLRHFLVPDKEILLHSNIFEVGKQKFLQELKRFEVGNESTGFELNQLGEVTQLGGSLAICSLEKIQAPEEAAQAKLIHKNHLHSLTLEWNGNPRSNDLQYEEKALEILIPHSNLRELCIRRHGGHTCPSWLGTNLSVKNLESLCLDGVAWELFPAIGELRLADGHCAEISSRSIPNTKFQNLRRLEFLKLQRLEEWVVDAPCQLFAHLKVLIIKDCPKLTKLSFSHSTCYHQEKEVNINWFPSLQELEIEYCPELQQFPRVPWHGAPCSARITGVGSCLKRLVCEENSNSEYSMTIYGKDASDTMLWDMLVFPNLTELKMLRMYECPPLPLHHLQMLSSLKDLTVSFSTNVFVLDGSESHAQYQFPIESMAINGCSASGKELTHQLTCLPNLSQLALRFCEKIRGLDVAEQQQSKAAHDPSRSSSGNEVDEVQNAQQEQDASGEKEITGALVDDGVLLLPPQLQTLEISWCPELILRFDALDDSKEAARTGGRGGGLQGLKSLRSLAIGQCPRFFSSYPPSSFSSSCFPFPNSLEELSLSRTVGGMETLLPLSNLTSLTDLAILRCGDLRGEGLWHLLAQGHLTKLNICEAPNFFTGSEPSLPHEHALPSSSTKPHTLWTDDVAGLLATPICTLLSSWLTHLDFDGVNEVERFTEKQEEALALLSSLEQIGFWSCHKLQRLPAGLHGLSKLKRLVMYNCAAIQSVPKDCLPSSLQELVIRNCKAMQCLPKDGLPSSLEELKISYCPAMQPLPKVDSLPNSLRVLNVQYSGSEELRRQCRKLIGIIPIVKA
ncbi:hypothetical protein BS78_06G237200 [Paspalum vaginatum]|nr:hypothetical protein BS78_06G237200 [Paspalum vaginatum]